WTVYFRNNGKSDTPVVAAIQALDLRLRRKSGAEFLLHHQRGDFNTPDSYQPFTEVLLPNSARSFTPVGGRPTNSAFPYYNLQMPEGGLIFAVGWPGQWAAGFQRDAGRDLHIRAGQELTHLKLKPGEEIRTPLMALLFWRGADKVRAQNIWRRWMLAHNLPRPGGKLPGPIYAFCDGAFFPGLKTSEAGEKQFIDVLTREKIQIDYWWIDAGWYPCGDGWTRTGTWEPDPVRYPRGIRPVSDYVHARGMKLVVWFEPERVTEGSWLAKAHPGWLLGGRLLNLGNPDARRWLTGHVDRLIREQGIDLYRQDFNMDPLDFWRKNDTPDRQGITENLHVQGYLAYWDELRRRHPDLLIDSCASGGRRNDLETMRRAVPLLRSDYQSFDGAPAFATGNQGHTYGLSSWLPYYGQGVYITGENPVYYARSHMSPAFVVAVDVRKPGRDWDLYRRLVSQWRQVADRMLGDYYPLTPYSVEGGEWIAWQFDRPEQGDGMLQAFRRDGTGEAARSFRLQGLDPSAKYRLTDMDRGTQQTVSGKCLLGKGFVVEIKAWPGAALLAYSKVK
ncbi:MAG: alpha-galactosidase, partial [Acidobacteria bacterium]|nr:alpha-galactosidase [Acidobacteriota bacterium]